MLGSLGQGAEEELLVGAFTIVAVPYLEPARSAEARHIFDPYHESR
jgi:hypothetical protein